MHNLTFYKKALQLHKHVGQSYKNWVIFPSHNQETEYMIFYVMKNCLFWRMLRLNDWFMQYLFYFHVNYVDFNSQMIINITQNIYKEM